MKIILLIIVLLLQYINTLPITSLPLYNGPQLNMDSGYINIDVNKGQNVFYWFIESTSDTPKNDPLVIWFQGGPGCSGLVGLFSENGPFSLEHNDSIVYSDLSWTNFANVLWIEQPLGVGFSYSNDPNDFYTNDTEAAALNYKFLSKWLDAFPQYKTSDFWLTGESYAGSYVPMLSKEIISHGGYINNNFQGFMIGNPVIDCPISHTPEINNYYTQQLSLYYWHGLVSYRNWYKWNKNDCDNNYDSDTCQDAFNAAIDELGDIQQEAITPKQLFNFASVDPDNVYQDFCTGNGSFATRCTHADRSECYSLGDRRGDYLNRADVQKAIHAKPTQWGSCANLGWTSDHGDINNYYKYFFKNKPSGKVLVYSGDVDISTVPFSFTQYCLFDLQQEYKTPWQPWFVNGATAGYYEEFDTFSYATIRGGGHETPEYQPLASYAMITRFMKTGSVQDPDDPPMKRASMRDEVLTQGAILRNLRKKQQMEALNIKY